MYYHVIIESDASPTGDVRFDLSADDVRKRIVEPRQEGTSFVLGGRSYAAASVRRIRIFSTAESADATKTAIHSRSYDQLARSGRLTTDTAAAARPDDMTVAMSGRDVTDEFLTSPPALASGPAAADAAGQPDPDKFFLIHGRNVKAAQALTEFAESLGLRRFYLRQAAMQPVSYIGSMLDEAHRKAQVILVLFTPDEYVSLRPHLADPADESSETVGCLQPRPNVLFEAGIALGRWEGRTVLVQLGHVRTFSDISGRYRVVMDPGSENKRAELKDFIEKARQKTFVLADDKWKKAGDFASSVEKLCLPFDDDPLSHDWRAANNSQDKWKVTVEADPDYGRVSTVRGTSFGLDYDLGPPAASGTVVAFVAKPLDRDAAVLVCVLCTKNGDSQKLWLKCRLRGGAASGTQGPPDYLWAFEPETKALRSGWHQYVVDLRAAGPDTYEKNGWNRLRIAGLRLQPSLSIASIVVS